MHLGVIKNEVLITTREARGVSFTITANSLIFFEKVKYSVFREEKLWKIVRISSSQKVLTCFQKIISFICLGKNDGIDIDRVLLAKNKDY